MTKYNIYGVNFKDNGKVYNFKCPFRCPINVTVITETEKGLQFGKVVSYLGTKEETEEYKDIIRISTKNDYEQYLKNLRDADMALKSCREFAKELGLDMRVINASFTFDRKQLIFNFLADERIDFRELARKLASIYRTRIELRQIGARDKAREVGGVGVCGKSLCCATFLSHIDTVSVNMVKNQGLAINPSKINGLCGRLLCCLTFEEEEYQRCLKGMPDIGEIVVTESGKGPVVSVNPLKRSYQVSINNENIEVNLGEENASSLE